LYIYIYNLKITENKIFLKNFTLKGKAEQRDDRVAGYFNPKSYIPDNGPLG
jgi:hypothetical protein